MDERISKVLMTNIVKQEALKLLKDPKLVPKEKAILEDIIDNESKNLRGNDGVYRIKMEVSNVSYTNKTIEIPSNFICDLIIFPWRWIGVSHKERQDVSPHILIAKKKLFQAYKHGLHKRKYKHLKKKVNN